MEKVRPWCGQPSDRGRLKYRTEQKQQSFTSYSNKKRDTKLIAVTLLSNLHRFLKFVNRQILQEICNKAALLNIAPYFAYTATPTDVMLPDSSPSDYVTKGEMI